MPLYFAGFVGFLRFFAAFILHWILIAVLILAPAWPGDTSFILVPALIIPA